MGYYGGSHTIEHHSVCAGDTWMLHIKIRRALRDIPLVGESKVYDMIPDSWLTDGVYIYMKYGCSRRKRTY